MVDEVRDRFGAIVLEDVETRTQGENKKEEDDQLHDKSSLSSDDCNYETAVYKSSLSSGSQDSARHGSESGISKAHEGASPNIGVPPPPYYYYNNNSSSSSFILGPDDKGIRINPTTRYPPCPFCASRNTATNNPVPAPALEDLPPIARYYQGKRAQHEQEQKRRRMMGLAEDPPMQTLHEFHDAMKRLEQIGRERVERAKQERIYYEGTGDDTDDGLGEFDEGGDVHMPEDVVVRSRL
ncbi:hypothetical protein F5Y08DRAFT_80978 [Xylaria arbuscula]|nr:hypothetical protein F5Y08DRAFT_80978 [Xylaria arbuscula]